MKEKLTYREDEDGLLVPNVHLEGYTEMGRYGRMAFEYLREHNNMRASEMFLDGTLWEVMSAVNEEAESQIFELEQAMLEADPPPVTEDFLAVASHRNHIHSRAEEIVIHEFVAQAR